MSYVPHLFAGSETMVFAASVLIQATVVILFVLLLGRWLRHQPALRHSVLLGGLMCVCFCPVGTYLADRIDVPLVSIALPSAPASHAERKAPPATRESATAYSSAEAPDTFQLLPPIVTAGPPAISPDVLKVNSTPSTPPVSEKVIGASDTLLADQTPRALSGSEITDGLDWTKVANVAGLIWLVGMAVISIRLLLAWRYLSRLRSGAYPLHQQEVPQLQQVSERVLRAVPARQLPPLFVSDQVKGPISLGLFQPAIVLPTKLTLALNSSQLGDVLIHETAHIHRHDHVVVLMQRLAGVFFWPFPLVRQLNAKIDQAREDVCDNYVLRHTQASQYSRMLLELTEGVAPSQAIPLAVGLWQCRRKLE